MDTVEFEKAEFSNPALGKKVEELFAGRSQSTHDRTLNTRALNVLKQKGILYAGDLVRLTADELGRQRHIGECTRRQIVEVLQ